MKSIENRVSKMGTLKVIFKMEFWSFLNWWIDDESLVMEFSEGIENWFFKKYLTIWKLVLQSWKWHYENGIFNIDIVFNYFLRTYEMRLWINYYKSISWGFKSLKTIENSLVAHNIFKQIHNDSILIKCQISTEYLLTLCPYPCIYSEGMHRLNV